MKGNEETVGQRRERKKQEGRLCNVGKPIRKLRNRTRMKV